MGSTYFTNRIKNLLAKDAKGRKKRPKTFKSEEAAKVYAEKHGIKHYELENMKFASSKTKKIRILQKQEKA